VNARAPKHMTGVKPGTTVALNTAVYGLAESGRAWYEAIKAFYTKESGLRVSERDPELFYEGEDEDMLMVAVYVVRMTIAGPSQKVMKVKERLAKRRQLKDQGESTFLL